MNFAGIPVRELLPHEPPMVMLDRVVSYEETKLTTEITVRRECPFCEDDGVPGWVGIEYMAQCVAAHAGAKGRLRGEPPLLGFLLGTRAYKCTVERFPLGETLTVLAEQLFSESGLGAFACSIETDRPVATATINVYQPDKDSLNDFWAGKLSK